MGDNLVRTAWLKYQNVVIIRSPVFKSYMLNVNPVQTHSFTMKSHVLDARAKGLIYFKNFYLPVIGDSN